MMNIKYLLLKMMGKRTKYLKRDVFLTTQNKFRAFLSRFCFHFGNFMKLRLFMPNTPLNSTEDKYD